MQNNNKYKIAEFKKYVDKSSLDYIPSPDDLKIKLKKANKTSQELTRFSSCHGLLGNIFFEIDDKELPEFIEYLFDFYVYPKKSKDKNIFENLYLQHNSFCTHFGKYIHTSNTSQVNKGDNILEFLDDFILFGAGNDEDFKKYTGTSAAAQSAYALFWCFPFIINNKQNCLGNLMLDMNYKFKINEFFIKNKFNPNTKQEIDKIDLTNIQQTLFPLDNQAENYINIISIPRLQEVNAIRSKRFDSDFKFLINSHKLKIGGANPINAGLMNSQMVGDVFVFKHRNIGVTKNISPESIIFKKQFFSIKGSLFQSLRNRIKILKNEHVPNKICESLMMETVVDFLNDFLTPLDSSFSYIKKEFLREEKFIEKFKDKSLLYFLAFHNEKGFNILKEDVMKYMISSFNQDWDNVIASRRFYIINLIEKNVEEYLKENYGE